MNGEKRVDVVLSTEQTQNYVVLGYSLVTASELTDCRLTWNKTALKN